MRESRPPLRISSTLANPVPFCDFHPHSYLRPTATEGSLITPTVDRSVIAHNDPMPVEPLEYRPDDHRPKAWYSSPKLLWIFLAFIALQIVTAVAAQTLITSSAIGIQSSHRDIVVLVLQPI